MSSLPFLPVNIVNRILREAAVLHGEKSVPKFIFSKAKQQYIFRARFRKRYLRRQFANVERLLRFKVKNPPEFTLILPTTVNTPFRELNKFRDCDQTPEEREATVSRMRSATIVRFPQKTHTYPNGNELEYRYSYCSFDNGYVFIEKNTLLDDDDYYLLFYRGYICLDGRTFPIFETPEMLHSYQEDNPHGINNCTEVRYLEKELGQKVQIPDNSQTICRVYDEDKKEWSYSRDYSFTVKEARFLVPFYEEPEEYYSD